MSSRTVRIAQERRRGHQARLDRALEVQARAARVEEALQTISAAYPRSRESRAVWLENELEIGRALVQLAADQLLLHELAAGTGLPAAECRRLMKAARASDATHVTGSARY